MSGVEGDEQTATAPSAPSAESVGLESPDTPTVEEGDAYNVDLDSDEDLFPAAAASAVQPSKTSDENQNSANAFAVLETSGGVVESSGGSNSTTSNSYPTNPSVPYVSLADAASSASGIAGASLSPSSIPKSIHDPTQGVTDKDGHFIVVTVTEPTKIGDGVNAYMRFTVMTRTNFTYFKSSHFSVFRRFSDFLGLHDKLVEKHIHYGRIVPPCPEKNMSGMTKVKMGKEETSAGSEFILRRKAALERFINRCLDHPNLRNDPDMRDFLERDELPRASHTSALSGKSLLKRFGSVAETVTAKPTKIPNDPDQWFEMKQVQVENLETQMRKLATNIEGLVHTRQELSGHSATFAKSIALLGNTEENTVLSRALSQLSELEERIEQLHANQAVNDFNIFCELIRDYCGLMKAVKDAFLQRTKTWNDWQSVEAALLKKREVESRMQMSGRTEKVPALKAEIEQLVSNAASKKLEFENISDNLKKELSVFEEKRVNEFKNKLIQYLETLLETQQNLVKYWTEYLPEAKAIAS